jgi:hypothetical protein
VEIASVFASDLHREGAILFALFRIPALSCVLSGHLVRSQDALWGCQLVTHVIARPVPAQPLLGTEVWMAVDRRSLGVLKASCEAVCMRRCGTVVLVFVKIWSRAR